MELNLKRPLVFFDLETTGVDTVNDRIVEVSMIKIMPSGEEVVRTRRIPTLLPTIITEREIVPVWWDMTTEMGSEEITNDFSFGEMMDALRLT